MIALDVVVPVPPGEVAINRRYAKEGVLAKRWRAGRDEIALHLRQAWRRRPLQCPVMVTIVEHWPTPRGDVDSPIKAVLDALQHAEVIVNDRQVVEVTATRAPGRGGSLSIKVTALQD